MDDLVRQAQGSFISNSVDYSGSALETTGNMLAVAGYSVSTTGAGAGIGAAMSGVGNAMSYMGTGLRVATTAMNRDHIQTGIVIVGGITNFGIGKLAKYGSAGKEAIDGGVNLFFTPMNTMVNNLEYKKNKK